MIAIFQPRLSFLLGVGDSTDDVMGGRIALPDHFSDRKPRTRTSADPEEPGKPIQEALILLVAPGLVVCEYRPETLHDHQVAFNVLR